MKIIIAILFFIIGFIYPKEEKYSKLKEADNLNLKNNYDDIDFYLKEELLEYFKNLPKNKFESFEIENEFYHTRSMEVQETDTYELKCSYTLFALYNEEGKLILFEDGPSKIFLYKGSIIYAEFIYFGFTENFKFEIIRKNNKVNLPFDPINIIPPSNFDTSSALKDPLKPAEVNYKKRAGNYLYINSNNPEKLTDFDLNKALIRLDISNKEVFFTFEHSTENINVETKIYSGFQVRNTGSSNLEVKIKNIGFQYNGPGYFFGEKEWQKLKPCFAKMTKEKDEKIKMPLVSAMGEIAKILGTTITENDLLDYIDDIYNSSIQFSEWLLSMKNVDKRYLLAESKIPEPPQKYDYYAIN